MGALKGTGVREEQLGNVMLHCTNPGQVGYVKFCANWCRVRDEDGSHGC